MNTNESNGENVENIQEQWEGHIPSIVSVRIYKKKFTILKSDKHYQVHWWWNKICQYWQKYMPY